MPSNPGALPPFTAPTRNADPAPLADLHKAFLTHKYLLLAILNCLQERTPRRSNPSQQSQMQDSLVVDRWMQEPSAERELTPCVVLREHHDRSDLSVVRLKVEKMSLGERSLAAWMRSAVPPSSQPDRDTLHLAIAPTLPGVPILVHSIGADRSSLTHMFSEGSWSRSANDDDVLRAVRYAQLVATAITLSGEVTHETRSVPARQSDAPLAGDVEKPCDLTTLGQRYDHIAVHAALTELKEFSSVLRGGGSQTRAETRTSRELLH